MLSEGATSGVDSISCKEDFLCLRFRFSLESLRIIRTQWLLRVVDFDVFGQFKVILWISTRVVE